MGFKDYLAEAKVMTPAKVKSHEKKIAKAIEKLEQEIAAYKETVRAGASENGISYKDYFHDAYVSNIEYSMKEYVKKYFNKTFPKLLNDIKNKSFYGSK